MLLLDSAEDSSLCREDPSLLGHLLKWVLQLQHRIQALNVALLVVFYGMRMNMSVVSTGIDNSNYASMHEAGLQGTVPGSADMECVQTENC